MDIFKGLVAGALAGVAAGYVMERFQAAWSQAMPDEEHGSSDGVGQEEPATVKAADRVSLAATGHRVATAQRETAGEMVHYATGAGVGALYGGLAELAPHATFGLGAAYGTAVAVGLDEMIVPALGLGKSAKETPPKTHIYSLASHLVYGLTLEGARRVIRFVL